MNDLDLTPEREIVESTFVDKCRITSDPEGVTDDVWNDETGFYEPAPAADSSTVYDGPCSVSVGAYQESIETEAGMQTVTLDGRAKIPVAVVAVEAGMWLFVYQAKNDPDLVGRRFTVMKVGASSFAVSRRLGLLARGRIQPERA